MEACPPLPAAVNCGASEARQPPPQLWAPIGASVVFGGSASFSLALLTRMSQMGRFLEFPGRLHRGGDV